MIEIDGSAGEGGGQVLRSSLSLSVLTGRAMRIRGIRAGRSKPGLMAQHLKAVEAAAAISDARVEGAFMGAGDLVFEPGPLQACDLRVDIGTAGATSLVLQTIFLPLSRAAGVSTVSLSGGTHVPWSPAFHYLTWQWLPFMQRLGLDGDLTLDLAGFYPRGGGHIRATIRPAPLPVALTLVDRGRLQRIRGLSALANLDPGIADRQRQQALARLQGVRCAVEIDTLDLPGRGKGSFVLLLADFEHGSGCSLALGARGKRAEQVADEAAAGLQAFLHSDGTVDEYLADQLLLPLALARGVSRLRTSSVTQHLLTNAQIIRRFLPVEIRIEGEPGRPGRVDIEV